MQRVVGIALGHEDLVDHDQLDRAPPGGVGAVTVAIALVEPLNRALARGGAAPRLGLQRHQPLGGKANHLAQKTGVGGLLQKRGKSNLVVGHRSGSLGSR